MNWKYVVPIVLLAPAMAFGQANAPSDAQIAGIVVTANQIDVDARKLAKAQSGPQAARRHTVRIEGMKFVPERLEVAAGDTIVWTNRDFLTA